MTRERPSVSAVVGRWLLAATIPAAANALGALLTVPLVAVTCAAALACALLWHEAPQRLSKSAQLLVMAWALLMAFTLLQAVPLPASVVRVVAPGNAEIWERVMSPFQEGAPRWHPITLAPAATRAELLRGLFYGFLFLGGLRISTQEGGTSFLERVVIASTCSVALVSLAHAAVDAKRVFGVYAPREQYAYLPGRFGPLLNSNHLAAYLVGGTCVALGTLFSRRPAMPRALALAAALVLAGTSVWAASRGGMGALAIGVVFVIALSAYTRRRFSGARAEVLVPIAIALAAAVMLALGLSEGAREELTSKDVSKVRLAIDALRLVPRSPVFGVGRGAFESVFPTVRLGDEYVTFTHPENIAVQWITEWGVPASVAAAAMIGWAMRPSVVLTAARPVIGSWVGIIALLVHDLADFHLEVPGVTAIAVLMAAMVTGARAHSPGPENARSLSRLRLLTWGAVASTVPLVSWAVPDASHSLADDRGNLSRSAVDAATSRDVFRSELRNAMLRYPAEAFLPLMGAVRAQSFGDDRVVPWIGRALENNPHFGRAHLVLARSLARRYRAQARLEYRLAFEADVSLRDAVLKESESLVEDEQSARELVPDGAVGVAVLEHLAEAVGPRLPSTSARLDVELAARSPDAPGLLRRRVASALSDVANAHPWCAPRDVCVHEAVAAAQTLAARDRQRCDSQLLLAKVRVAAGDPLTAYDELDRAADATTESGTCRRALVQLAIDTKQSRRADIALERVTKAGCGSNEQCADLYAWAGSIHDQRGNLAASMGAYKRAIELDPERTDLALRMNELAFEVGVFADAIEVSSMMARRHPEDHRWLASLDELQAAVQRRRAAQP